MKQADLGLNLSTRRAGKHEFLDEMNRVVPWAALVALEMTHAPAGRRCRPLFPVETMLGIHFMEQWFDLSDPAMEKVLCDVPLSREFAGLYTCNGGREARFSGCQCVRSIKPRRESA